MKKHALRIWAAAMLALLLMAGCGTNNAAPQQTAPAQTNAVQQTADSGNAISEQQAKEIALTHAKVEEKDVSAIRITKDREDGQDVYEVDFYVEGKEYEYEISMTDGTIVKSEFDVKGNWDWHTDVQDVQIAVEQAMYTALERVEGAQEKDVVYLYYEKEDGRAVYEGKILYSEKEYKFQIDVNTGDVVKWEEKTAAK